MSVRPLDAIRLKVKRAQKHLSDFKAAIGTGPQSKRSPAASGIHLDTDRWTVGFRSNEIAPGPEEGIILGEAIHQLRASLDHIICALIGRTNANASTICEDYKFQFPLCKSEIDFKALRYVSQGTLQHFIGADELAEVEGSQPYKRRPQKPTRDHLYMLGQLDNIDKHRIVLVLNHAVNLSGHFDKAGTHIPFTVHKQKVVPGTQVLDIGGSFPDPPFGVHVENLSPHVVFAETNNTIDNLKVTTAVRRMLRAVDETIDKFDRFF